MSKMGETLLLALSLGKLQAKMSRNYTQRTRHFALPLSHKFRCKLDFISVYYFHVTIQPPKAVDGCNVH